MIPVCRAATTRALDASVIGGLGMPGALLMELAGRGVADLIAQRHPRGAVAVLCGPGNNGGDGYVIARWLHLWGWSVRLWSAGPPRTPDAALNADLCARMGLSPLALEAALDGATLAVDALLGTGQASTLRGVMAAAVEALLARPQLPVVAVDLPTGMDADRGVSLGRCVRASWTATLGRWKPGLLTAAGRRNSGPVSLIDIGLDLGRLLHSELDRPDAWLLEEVDLRSWLPLRSPADAKWDRGHVAVRGGGGAAVLAAQAALRGGAGLVTLLAPRADWPRLHGLWPSIILAEPGALDPTRHDVLVIGPGLGLSASTQAEVLSRWSDWPGALVADADALTALAAAPQAAPRPGGPLRLITPHAAEAARLLGVTRDAVDGDRLDAAERLASWGTCLLKGPFTIIGGAPPLICPRGGPALATAGTGDVLAGLTGALLAQGLSAERAGALAAWIHGAAGETLPPDGATADDVVSRLPEAIRLLRGASTGNHPDERRE